MTGSRKVVLQRPSIPHNGIVVSSLRLCVWLRQQQCFAGIRKTTRRYTVPIHVQDLRKPAKLNVHMSLRPCRPHSVSNTLQILQPKRSHRRVQSVFKTLVAFLIVLVSLMVRTLIVLFISGRNSYPFWNVQRMSSRNSPSGCGSVVSGQSRD